MYSANAGIAAAVLSLAAFTTLAPSSEQRMQLQIRRMKTDSVKAKPVPDLPFFFVIDNQATYSYLFKDVNPGVYSVDRTVR